jgi:hypothetical protein
VFERNKKAEKKKRKKKIKKIKLGLREPFRPSTASSPQPSTAEPEPVPPSLSLPSLPGGPHLSSLSPPLIPLLLLWKRPEFTPSSIP